MKICKTGSRSGKTKNISKNHWHWGNHQPIFLIYFPTKNTFQGYRIFSLSDLMDSFFNEAILLKGARQFYFERISSRLEQKRHETVMEINLNALVHNFNFCVLS